MSRPRFVPVAFVETNYCQVPYEILLGVGRFDPVRSQFDSHDGVHSCADSTCDGTHHGHDQHGHDHSKVFSTWSYETDQPLVLDRLREKLRKLPGSIYRAKGFIYSTDAPHRRAVLQVVGRRVDISL